MAEPQALVADRYRLLHRVGSGGMGVVWEGRDERLERRVALKQFYRQSGSSTREAELANQRALREARLTARLQHPHAVPVFDAVEQDGQLWLVMQFIPSITLAAVLEQGGPLQPNEAAKVGAEVASALAAAHAVGIVHRDVKPGNILIAEDGAALISDFGIARALGDATLTSSGMIHGTPAYLAPEVARGSEANFASDVFSLGSTLYSVLEGRPPFGTDDNTMALLHRVASGQFPPPQRSGPLTPVIMHMLAIDTDVRPSMGAVAEGLARLAKGRPTERRSFWQRRMKGLKMNRPLRGILQARPAGCWSFASRGTEVTSSVSSAQPCSAPARTPTQARSRGRRGRRCPYRYRNLPDCPVRERSQSRQSDARPRPVDLDRACDHKSFHAVRAAPYTFTDSQSVRTATGSSTKTDATKQTSYAIPGTIANDRTDRPRHAHRGAAQTGNHQLLRVDAAQHRYSLAADDRLVPNQPCRRAAGVPAILGCHQQDHCG